MKKILTRIDYLIKHNRIIQIFYKCLFSIIFRFIGLFVKVNSRYVLFTGHGKRYNDSPKVIFEKMLVSDFFKDYIFYWGVDDPQKYNIQNSRVIKIDTFKYFIIALKSKVWISSVNIERGLRFKNKKTIYINTWHGIPLKHIGNAVKERSDYDFSHIDIFCASSNYDKNIYVKDLKVNPKNIILSGLPRNDALYNQDDKKIEEIKRKLKIPFDKKIILYAPTWRDNMDNSLLTSLKPPININYWKKELLDDYIVLFRLHPYTTKAMNICFDYFARDFSQYSDVNELLMISDILVSDYSATIFDYSLLERPFYCFAYDYDEYSTTRGLYLDLNETIPDGIFKTEVELLNRITMNANDESRNKYIDFKNKFFISNSSATNQVILKLKEKLNK